MSMRKVSAFKLRPAGLDRSGTVEQSASKYFRCFRKREPFPLAAVYYEEQCGNKEVIKPRNLIFANLIFM